MEFRPHTTVHEEELLLGEGLLNIKPFGNRELIAYFSCVSKQHIT